MLPRTLGDFVSPSRQSGQELNFQTCPVCGSTGWNTYVNPLTGAWYCFAARHTENKGGAVEVDYDSDQARQVMLRVLAENYTEDYTWPEVHLPETRPIGGFTFKYLESRGLSSDLIHQLAFREMVDEPRLLVPFFGLEGRVIGWTGRLVYAPATHTNPKYRGPSGDKPPYMLPRWGEVDEAVLVEGPFDAIAVYQHTGMNAIAVGGTSLSKRVEHDIRQLVSKTVHILLDGDAGVKALSMYEQLADRFKVKVHLLPDEEDPGTLNPEQLRRVLQ